MAQARFCVALYLLPNSKGDNMYILNYAAAAIVTAFCASALAQDDSSSPEQTSAESELMVTTAPVSSVTALTNAAPTSVAAFFGLLPLGPAPLSLSDERKA